MRKSLLSLTKWVEVIFFLFACLIIPPFVLVCPSPVCFWRVSPPLSSPAGLLLLMQGCSQLPAVIKPVLGYPENKMLLLDSWSRALCVTSPPASFLYLIPFQAVSASAWPVRKEALCSTSVQMQLISPFSRPFPSCLSCLPLPNSPGSQVHRQQLRPGELVRHPLSAETECYYLCSRAAQK